MAPGDLSLLEGSRSEGLTLWWVVRPMLHERILRPIWFRTPEAISRLSPEPLSPLRVWGNVRLGRSAARTVRVQDLDAFRDGERRLLYTGQNNQWPAADGTPADRFFGRLLLRLQAEGVKTASTFPVSTNFPWYRPGQGRQIARSRNRSAGMAPHVPFEGFAGRPAWRAFRSACDLFSARAETIEAGWDEVEGDLPFPDPESSRSARDGVVHLHRTALPAFVFLLETARAAIERLKPHVVVMINEYGTFERALMLAAQERAIPVVALQHGAIYPAHPGYAYPARFLGDEVSPESRVPLPDRFAVYGAAHRRFLVDEVGWPDQRVVIAGHSKADRIHRLRRDAPPQRAATGRRRLLWFTQAHAQPEEEKRRNEATVLGALKALDQIELVIKPHPGESDTYGRMRRADRRVSVLPRGADLYAAVLDADVAMAKDSTAGLEAMALGRPVIVLNTTEAPDRLDYVEKGAALRARDVPTLMDALRRSLAADPTASARHAYVTDQFGPIDGRTTERLCAVILTALEEGRAAH